MSILAKKGQDYESCPLGAVQAVVSNVYDLGLQKQDGLYGENISPKVVIVWEVNHTMKTGKYAGKRFVLSKTYTNTMNEKSNLFKDLRAMIGEKAKPGIDLEKLRGFNVQLNVQENSKGYATIISIMPIAAGTQKMIPELEKEHIPEWIVKKQNMQVSEEDRFYEGDGKAGTFEDGEPFPGEPYSGDDPLDKDTEAF